MHPAAAGSPLSAPPRHALPPVLGASGANEALKTRAPSLDFLSDCSTCSFTLQEHLGRVGDTASGACLAIPHASRIVQGLALEGHTQAETGVGRQPGCPHGAPQHSWCAGSLGRRTAAPRERRCAPAPEGPGSQGRQCSWSPYVRYTQGPCRRRLAWSERGGWDPGAKADAGERPLRW